MYRMGWSLLSPWQELTRLNKETLYNHFHNGYPHCREDDRPYQKYGNVTCTDEQWEQPCIWLTGDPTFRSKVERHRKELKDKIVGKRDDSDDRHKARRIAPLLAQAVHPLLLVPITAIGPPRRLRQEGGGSEGNPPDSYWAYHLSQNLSESGGLSHCFPLLRVIS